MELINKKDALHAVLHNTGDAAVAAVQNIKPINPKEGEWIMDGKYNRHCSRCNENVVWSFNYCPNCGAKMKGANDADN